MNNTTTRRNLTIVAIFMAATLVVGTLATTITITQTAFAFSKKKGDENSKNGNTITIQKCKQATQSAYAYNKKDNGKDGNGNGNTVTIQKCKQAAIQSGFDNNQGQECENVICTHPGENATCVQEAAAAAQAQVKLTCEQCFTKFLTTAQISKLLSLSPEFTTLEQLCGLLPEVRVVDLQLALGRIGGSSVAAQLIQCLLNAGIVFSTTPPVIR
jgi:hypothetical protein